MKTIKPFLTIIALSFISSFVFFSCRVSKTAALRCPQVLTKENNKVLAKYKTHRNTAFIPQYRATIRKQPARRLISLTRKNHLKNIDVLNNSPIHENVMVSGPAYLNGLSKIEYTKRLTASIDEKVMPLRENYLFGFLSEDTDKTDNKADVIAVQPDRCDTIIFKSGFMVICKVMEIGQNNLTYRKCDDLRGPVYSGLKSDVLEIRAYNGKQILVTSSDPSPYRTDNIKKTVKSGLAGLFISLIGLILFAILLEYYIKAAIIIGIVAGVTSIILGVKSLTKVIRHSDYYKGKFLSILIMVIGGIDIFIAVMLVLLLMAAG
jgi:hypothetical protein